MKYPVIFRMLPFMIPLVFVIPVLTIWLQKDSSLISSHDIQQVKTIFTGIFLEALPFVLLGVLMSSLLQMFVKEQWVRRITPKNPVVGVLFASMLGIMFPICECGMIPVVRRLMLKGMPAYIAVTFILSGPILNPIVFAATIMAFRSHPEVTIGRMGLAFAVAVTVGLLVYVFSRSNPLKRSFQEFSERDSANGGRKLHEHPKTWRSMFVHAGDEWIEMGKYLVLGAFLTACIQSFIPREELLALGSGPVSSYLFMMGFAFILSLCSTSDAFVASAFTHTFTVGPLVSFLVLGPMLDFKSLLMLSATFKTKFVIGLSLLVITLVFIGSVAVDALLGG
ncbi:permease [Paenibacillus lautus]|uniref:permease n=1 Tax=Paenibacillus lautus TaxID=1401 RepID=UPI002DB600AB|nr:permease [Paenibacillus lautus]MEC0202870.1 permease [Paenibacillus lautus]